MIYSVHVTVSMIWKCIFLCSTFGESGHQTYSSLQEILPATLYLKRGSYMTHNFWTRAKINLTKSISLTGPLCILCPPPIFAHVEITSQSDAWSVVYVNKSLFHDPFILWTREKPWFIISILWIISLKP